MQASRRPQPDQHSLFLSRLHLTFHSPDWYSYYMFYIGMKDQSLVQCQPTARDKNIKLNYLPQFSLYFTIKRELN